MRAVRVFAVLVATVGVAYLAYGVVGETASAATAKPSPLFVYEEGSDTVSFFSPKTVRIVHGARGDAGVHACQYDLPDHGNMYSGADMQNAFRGVVVQGELHARRMYLSPETGNVTVGSAGPDRAEWIAACYGCTAEPPAMQQFHAMLRVVMLNARLVCP